MQNLKMLLASKQVLVVSNTAKIAVYPATANLLGGSWWHSQLLIRHRLTVIREKCV